MPYSIKTKPNDAKAYGRGLSISFKKSVIISKKIRGMNLQKAKNLLNDAINGERTIDGSRYYTKTAEGILNLLESAESNAEDKELDKSKLRVHHISAHKGRKAFRPTRMRFKRGPWRMKNTHVEIVLREKRGK